MVFKGDDVDFETPTVSPFPLRTSTPVWHYTDVNGLLGIVRSKTLWASAPQVLNDSSEVLYGVAIIREAWRDFKRQESPSELESHFIDMVLGDQWVEYIQSQIFVVSASIESDLLSQWRNYARTDGYAIGLDVSGHWGQKAILRDGQLVLVTPVVNGWYDVVYDRVKQRAAADRLVRMLLGFAPSQDVLGRDLEQIAEAALSARLIISALPLTMKHPAFSDEREARYVGGAAELGVQYRATSGRLTPYAAVGVHANDEKGYPSDAEEQFPLTEIMCGPGCREGTVEVLRRYLTAEGFDHVNVTASQIPFISQA